MAILAGTVVSILILAIIYIIRLTQLMYIMKHNMMIWNTMLTGFSILLKLSLP